MNVLRVHSISAEKDSRSSLYSDRWSEIFKDTGGGNPLFERFDRRLIEHVEEMACDIWFKTSCFSL